MKIGKDNFKKIRRGGILTSQHNSGNEKNTQLETYTIKEIL